MTISVKHKRLNMYFT